MSYMKKALHEGLVEQELDNPIDPTYPIRLEVPEASKPKNATGRGSVNEDIRCSRSLEDRSIASG